MLDLHRFPLLVVLAALGLALWGIALDASGGETLPAAYARSEAGAQPSAPGDEMPFERVLFGTSLDDERLEAGAQPLLVYRVPAGSELLVSDVDATAGGLVLLRRSQQRLVQVGFIVDRGSVGLGQSSRSYATGINFGPGEELLVQAAGGDVEWAALRGVIRPAGPSVAGP
ncbi:MAG TPA: hypothetical protein VFD43_00370 [Planctomycetota bacterium]|nr:hypothetical protein [Planctomycetota bacterium]